MSYVGGNIDTVASDEECPPPVYDGIPRFTAEEKFATLTECIGSESLTESVMSRSGGGGDTMVALEEEEEAAVRSRKMKNDEAKFDNFPPMMSTLNANGLLKLEFIKNDGIPGYIAEEKLSTVTECIGFESSTESAMFHYGNSSDTMTALEEEARARRRMELQNPSSRSVRSRKMKNDGAKSVNFLPLLSTLNVNGRPKLEFIKTRENGHLKVRMARNLRQKLGFIKSRENGRLKMSIVGTP